MGIRKAKFYSLIDVNMEGKSGLANPKVDSCQ